MRIAVATPAFGQRVTMRYTTSLLAARDACAAHGLELIPFLTGGRALITLARSQMASTFLASPYDAILWIDADQSFRPQDVLAVAAGLHGDLPIVACPYPLKWLDWAQIREAAIAGAPADGLAGIGVRHVLAFDPNDTGPRGYVGPRRTVAGLEFVRVRRAGTGFLGIHRRVLETIVEKSDDDLRYRGPQDAGAPEIQHAFFRTEIEDEHWPPEDYAFCELARAHGFDVWLWPDGRVGHIGDFEYVGPFDIDAHARMQRGS